MMYRSLSSALAALLAILSLHINVASAIRKFESNSLSTCMDNSSFSATLFNVVFTPDNGSLAFSINGISKISSNVMLEFQVLGYGYEIYHDKIDPCTDSTLAGLCPMNAAPITLESNAKLPKSTVDQIPSAVYYIPDLDGKVKVYINDTSGNMLACVQAELSNGKTVYQKGVAWSVAIIAGLGLVISAVVSGLGHSNTAAHVASNAMSLFTYFQSQAFLGMCAVADPPIVRAWTQNFQWSMGIIHVGFLQKMATWYQRATGGTPSTYLSSLATISVSVQKRSLEYLSVPSNRGLNMAKSSLLGLVRRSNSQTTNAENLSTVTVMGIERAGFVANIEITNIFFTGYVFFVIFVIFVILGVVLFKYICEGLVKAGKMKSDKFTDFRNGWKLVLKGILYRVVLIGFPQMVVLCFWEMTKRDSAGEVVLAICTIITMLVILGWAAVKVWRIAQRSITMHKNPAYILYSDPKALNKWGFLYVQFKATMYYFIICILAYILVKGMFVAFGQDSGTAQAVGFVILDAGLLIATSVMRPYMDKKTNAFNISIAGVNFFNALLLLFFTQVFNIPALAIGVMGVLFFVINCVFAIVILLMVMWASVWALVSKNPDTRYQPMRDDRGSFIKSQTNLGTTELDALGATARGDGKHGFGPERKRMDLDDDIEGSSTEGTFVNSNVASRTDIPKQEAGYYGQAPRSPVEPPSAPMLRGGAASPYSRPMSDRSYGGAPSQDFRAQNSASPNPWQRGVGY